LEALGLAFRELAKQIHKAAPPGYVSEHRWLIAIVDQPAMFTRIRSGLFSTGTKALPFPL
jgi:hypothetical protein